MYGGDEMDAPFHPATDSPSHKGGGSIVFLTTDLGRIRQRMGQQETSLSNTLDYVAIRIDHGEVVGRGPNPQELLALLGALAITQRQAALGLSDKRIELDCKSLVDYINEHRHSRLRNEVGKLPFFRATQQYLQRDAAQQVLWVRSHPERRKPEQKDYGLDEWGIYIADCYASNKQTPQHLLGKAHIITAEHLV